MTTKTNLSPEAQNAIQQARDRIAKCWIETIINHRQTDWTGSYPKVLVVPDEQFGLMFDHGARDARFQGVPVYPQNQSASAPRIA